VVPPSPVTSALAVPSLAILEVLAGMAIVQSAAVAATLAVGVMVSIGAAAVCKGRQRRLWPTDRPLFRHRPRHVAVGRATTAAA